MTVNENLLISKETQEWLNILYESIYLVNKERKIIFCFIVAEQITGFESADMQGKQCEEFSLEHFDSNEHSKLTKQVNLEKIWNGKMIEAKLLVRHKKGYRIPVAMVGAPLKTTGGEIPGIVYIFKDISAEEKILQLEKRFKKVIRQYVSETTYKEILKTVNQENYQFSGKNRELTILFMDIVGFTSLSEKLTPEKVVEMLNAYFSLTSLIIQKNNGDIDKFLGDGVMAIFKDPNDSIQAAKDMMQTGLKKLNHTLRSMELPEINLRIGINSGNLIQGNIGSEERKDWTVVGDVVNTAYRIEESAEPGSIRLSEYTLKRLKNPENYLFVKEITLKGKSKPVRIYNPICIGSNSKFSSRNSKGFQK